jgi:hypothetical protein
METIGPSAFVVAILYFLSRWELATIEHAVAHPGVGRPEITWQIAWWFAMIVSVLGAISLHVRLLAETPPSPGVRLFNLIVFGGFLIGFFVSGQFDHRARLRAP